MGGGERTVLAGNRHMLVYLLTIQREPMAMKAVTMESYQLFKKTKCYSSFSCSLYTVYWELQKMFAKK